MQILFICTGNTCRSSMAQALARQEVDMLGLSGRVAVLSAGTHTVSGLPASENAVAVMCEMGVDLSGHFSSMLTRELIEESDLVLTMTVRHRMDVLEVCPEAAGKTHTLAEYAGVGADVVDPYGGSLEIYRRCAGQLREMVVRALNRAVKAGT